MIQRQGAFTRATSYCHTHHDVRELVLAIGGHGEAGSVARGGTQSGDERMLVPMRAGIATNETHTRQANTGSSNTGNNEAELCTTHMGACNFPGNNQIVTPTLP